MREQLQGVIEQVGGVLLGKDHQIRQALACLLAGGHLLIEDLPGMGKTILSHALARTLGLSYNRIQFTSDVLPADILGISIFDRNSAEFRFHPGPVFAQVVLADEINRTTPKTQSALLEAMEEGQVTVEGETRALPEPFFVIATQNPSSQAGTYPLPESQLDRFLMRIELGYPDRIAERELMRGQDRREMLELLEPRLTVDALAALQVAVRGVSTDALIDYVQRIVAHSRNASEFAWGLSPGVPWRFCARRRPGPSSTVETMSHLEDAGRAAAVASSIACGKRRDRAVVFRGLRWRSDCSRSWTW